MKRTFLIGFTLLAVGCATAATNKLKSAIAEIRTAESAGAAQDPEASPRLTQAQSEIARAETLLRGGKTGAAKSAASSAYDYAEEALKIVRAKGGSAATQAAATTP